MIDQKPRDPLYPQGFEDIDNLKNRQIPRPKPKENEDNDLKILKSLNGIWAPIPTTLEELWILAIQVTELIMQ